VAFDLAAIARGANLLCTVLFGGLQTGTRRGDDKDGELLVDEKSESSVQVD
jgi:hypothetical protein